MSTNQSRSLWKTYLRTASLCLVAIAFVSNQASSLSAHEPNSLRELLCELIQLSNSRDTREYADQQFTALSEYTPQDTRLPYLHALVMTDKLKYDKAIYAINRAVANNINNPDAWRAQIWLAVAYGNDFDGGLKSIEQLTLLMNDEQSNMLCSVQQSNEIADFMGRVYGFLSGPGEMDALRLYNAEQQLLEFMTPEQSSYFMLGRNSVMDEFDNRMTNISELRYDAQKTEDVVRSSKLNNAAKERSYLRDEMTNIEDNRLKARQQTSTERNVIAATRGSGYTTSRYYRRPYYSGTYHHGGYGGHSYERGLNDRHYANTNYREREYNNYLSDREQNLRRRMKRLEKDEERLVRKQNNGNSRKVLSEVKSASVLRTYVPFPVNTGQEIDRILASY